MTAATVQRVAGIPGAVDTADPSLTTRFEDRVGKCYEIAARYVVDASGAELVHGTIQGDGKPPLQHAWVEIAGDVFEPTSGHRMSAAEFTSYFRPTPRIRYSKQQAVVEMLRSGTYGAWDDEKPIETMQTAIGVWYSPNGRRWYATEEAARNAATCTTVGCAALASIGDEVCGNCRRAK